MTGIRDQSRIYIIDTFNNQVLKQFRSDLGSISGLSWSPDGKHLAVLNEDEVLTLWDIEAEVIFATYPAYGISKYDRGGVAYSLYGGRLAVSQALNQVESQRLLDRASADNITILADGAIQILVPAPSLDRLNAIAALCVRDGDTGIDGVQAVAETPDSLADLPAFIARVGALPADAIPPACAADLRAVAEALLAEGR